MCSHWRPRVVSMPVRSRVEAYRGAERVIVRTVEHQTMEFAPVRPEPGRCVVHGCENHTHDDERCAGGNVPRDAL